MLPEWVDFEWLFFDCSNPRLTVNSAPGEKLKCKVKQSLDGCLTCEAVKFLWTSVGSTYPGCAVNYVYEYWLNDWSSRNGK